MDSAQRKYTSHHVPDSEWINAGLQRCIGDHRDPVAPLSMIEFYTAKLASQKALKISISTRAMATFMPPAHTTKETTKILEMQSVASTR